jgi:hypothetical protein
LLLAVQAEDMARDEAFLRAFDEWTEGFAAHVGARGAVPAGKYRAYGYQRPAHRWADAKLWWRDRRMRLGLPRRGSSPAEQQHLGLNRDVTLDPKLGEGRKLRNKG